ncbi:hypothetical protein [Caulobacter endophyticus]|nr:hypothetical protein [Caulobacter endophyticus]
MQMAQWPALIVLALSVIVWGGIILYRGRRDGPQTAEEDLDPVSGD